ncbi:MAG: hypothetical protein IIX14_00300 [Clostridia bacterium]|nr:hypothetical protein [Clostridia bacterium]
MNCPKCGKPVINKDSLECMFCHSELYSDEKQKSRIKRKKRVKKIGSFFVVAIPTVLLWVAIIGVIKFAMKTPLQTLFTTEGTEACSEFSIVETNANEYPEGMVPDAYDVQNYTTLFAPQPTRSDVYTTTYAYENTSPLKDSSPSKTPKPSTTNKNNATAYQEEITKENQRHKDELELIESKYEIDIDDCEYWINFYRSYCGYAASSSYPSQISALEEKILQKEKKLALWKMDTSNMYAREIRALEAELEQDYARLSELSISYEYAVNAEQREKELKNLQHKKNLEINYENEKHTKAIQQINSKYGK